MALPRSYALPSFTWDKADPLIEMTGIAKVFRSTAGEVSALKGIDACVYKGEFVSVVGRSGSGKSTLVNMITGIDHPTGGTVRVGDTLLHNMNESRMSLWRGKHLGIVFQFFQLLPMLTVLENIMLPMDFCQMFSPADREERALQLLRRVGLEELAHKLPVAISGGQQQSVAVARCLANDPPIIIADEPTGNLDSRTAEEVIQLFEELVANGKTILMVTHDITLAQRTSRTLLISDGELVDEVVARFFHGLAYDKMLKLSHQGQRKIYQPGEAILGGNGENSHAFVIIRGETDVIRKATLLSSEQVVGSLMVGQYFDRPGINRIFGNSTQVRVNSVQPVEVLTFPIEVLQSITGGWEMSESKPERKAE